MSKSKCEMCSAESDHNYNNKELCKYHYWVAKGKPQDEYWKYIWKEYGNFHPVRVSHWRKKDPELDKFFEVD